MPTEAQSSPSSVPPASLAHGCPGPPPLQQGAVPVSPVVNHPPMATQGSLNFDSPPHTTPSLFSPIPKTYRVLSPILTGGLLWRKNSLLFRPNHNWDLVPPPPSANVVTGKWIFRHKFHADSSSDRYKARRVLHGLTQRPSVDYDETFSPVVESATVRTVLIPALSTVAYSSAGCQERVSSGDPNIDSLLLSASSLPCHVCRLNKSLFGLKQAP